MRSVSAQGDAIEDLCRGYGHPPHTVTPGDNFDFVRQNKRMQCDTSAVVRIGDVSIVHRLSEEDALNIDQIFQCAVVVGATFGVNRSMLLNTPRSPMWAYATLPSEKECGIFVDGQSHRQLCIGKNRLSCAKYHMHLHRQTVSLCNFAHPDDDAVQRCPGSSPSRVLCQPKYDMNFQLQHFRAPALPCVRVIPNPPPTPNPPDYK
jgi:hypothetical protein